MIVDAIDCCYCGCHKRNNGNVHFLHCRINFHHNLDRLVEMQMVCRFNTGKFLSEWNNNTLERKQMGSMVLRDNWKTKTGDTHIFC